MFESLGLLKAFSSAPQKSSLRGSWNFSGHRSCSNHRKLAWDFLGDSLLLAVGMATAFLFDYRSCRYGQHCYPLTGASFLLNDNAIKCKEVLWYRDTRRTMKIRYPGSCRPSISYCHKGHPQLATRPRSNVKHWTVRLSGPLEVASPVSDGHLPSQLVLIFWRDVLLFDIGGGGLLHSEFRCSRTSLPRPLRWRCARKIVNPGRHCP